MAKTIEQWYMELEAIDDSLNATKYARDNDRLTWQTDTMSEAINEGFTWSNTPEGAEHWADLHSQYQREEYKQSQPSNK